MAPSSEERVRAARAGFAAFGSGDHRKVVEVLSEDVQVFSSPQLANPGSYEGHEGYLEWVGAWVDAWEGLEMDVKEITPIGERHVLAEVNQVGHGRSGIEVSMEVAFLFDVNDDGLVDYLALHPDRKSALVDAELRERA